MKISNSKKELAKIISENGGWRDGAEWAAQDSDCRVSYFDGSEKPVRPSGKGEWCGNGYIRLARVKTGKLLQFWHTALISRAEYLHLYPAPDADGWIEWNGGDIDIDDMQLVDYRMACTPDGKHRTSPSMNLFWDKVGEPQDIIAYRLHKPEQEGSQAAGDNGGVVLDYGDLVASIDSSESPELRANLAKIYAPSIEQLAADYHNKLDYADRKQDEADKANMEADAALLELENAVAAIGFAITPIGGGLPAK